jgi:endonuclease/exonuclease/phosphatase (EEP) superfamily protein YafD
MANSESSFVSRSLSGLGRWLAPPGKNRHLERLPDIWVARLRVLLRVGCAILFAAAFSGYFAQVWICSLLVHFQIQYLLGAIVVLPVALLFRERLCAFLMLLAGLSALMHMEYKRARSDEAGPPVLKVMQFNRLHSNMNYDRMFTYLRNAERPPDIVTLQEVNPQILAYVTRQLIDIYPHHYPKNFLDDADIVVLSRLPFEKRGAISVGEDWGDKALRVTVKPLGTGRFVTIYTMHAQNPTRRGMTAERNRQLSEIARAIAADTSPYKIFMGDWNITPYDPFFNRILALSGLRNDYDGLWPTTTWPSWLYFSFLKIPIDQILASEAMVMTERFTGPYLGSDHHPVLASFALENIPPEKTSLEETSREKTSGDAERPALPALPAGREP